MISCSRDSGGAPFVLSVVSAAKVHNSGSGKCFEIRLTFCILTLLMVITKLRLKVFMLDPPLVIVIGLIQPSSMPRTPLKGPGGG